MDQLIRSLIYQIFGSSLKIPDAVCRLFAACANGTRQPPSGALLGVLHETLLALGETYIVIDALDECTERKELSRVFSDIVSRTSKLHFLVTSRKEPDIVSLIQPLATHQLGLEPEVMRADINTFISETLKSDDKLKLWSSKTHIQIEEVLMKGANGM